MSLNIDGVIHTPLPPVGREGDKYAGLNPGSTTLPQGHRKNDQSRALPVAMVWDRDIEIPMRDGIILRADIFRPTSSEKVPVLLAWGPYGKSGAGMLNLDFMPGRAGIPTTALSGYEKFEAPDPADWVCRGYAIAEVDARGVFDSQGNARMLGSGEGEDGHDAVEYIAQLPWCTGAVALVGNSWLAMAQYFIAAQHPPHLKCIAPLEGSSDVFRETLCRGGVPSPEFFGAIVNALSGHGHIENVAAMMGDVPVMNDYWEGKRAPMKDITVPAYVLASYSTGLHTAGSLRCYKETAGPKWLTIHDTQEWHDLYQPARTNDLLRFFDHYLKDAKNRWEETPPVRVSLLGFETVPNISNLAIPSYPHPSTTYKRLYLTSSQTLLEHPPLTPDYASYKSDVPAQQKGADPEELSFSYTFPKRTYLLGPSSAHLSVSATSHNDLDIYLQLRKADIHGNLLASYNIPQPDLDRVGIAREDVLPINILQYLGPTGMIRASRRELDEELSTPHEPQLSYSADIKKVTEGEIVEVDVGIWPTGMVFEAGESVVLKVAGHPMILAEFPVLWGAHGGGVNKGEHRVHFGEGKGSWVDVPIVEL